MRKYAAELLGTFVLVFAGTGAIVVNDETGALGHAGVAITFGLVVLAMIHTFGSTSGAHLNPAVTLAFFAARLFPLKEVVPYVLAQLTGAICASFSLHLLFPADAALGATIPAGSDMQSFALEVLLTFFLMLVILHVSQGSKETGVMAGTAIGAMVGLEALFAGPISGAGMNPARSIAPALITGQFDHLWIYIAAPIIGALAATFTWRWMRPPTSTTH